VPTPDVLTPTVTAAVRARPGHPCQDRHLILAGAVAVLDGATDPDEPQGRDGAWYADLLAAALAARLPGHGSDLADLVADAIAEVTDTHRLHPGACPTSTVTMLRWSGGGQPVEALALSDSPLILRQTSGIVHALADDRLNALAGRLRARCRARLADGAGYDTHHAHLLRQLRAELRAARNRPDGHYVAEADPAAARHALRLTLPTARIRDAALLTDGAAAAVDRYGLYPDWPALLDDLHTHGPDHLLDRLRQAEAGDPNGQRWPRAKPADDATVVYLRFTT
jgi:hypothetical protein